jgi:flagella basal body P-ring formation protein FlgA
MMNGQGPRPLSRKKTIQLLIILTIFAWATQTLLHQWGYGQTTQPADPQPTFSEEKFVPGTQRFEMGATLELRSEATVIGGEVKLKQICRWSDTDAPVFAPMAELVLMRLGQNVPFRSISVAEVKSLLHDAGVNLVAINFVGAASCTVGRSDVEFNEGEALQKWLDAREGKAGPADPTTSETPLAVSQDGVITASSTIPATQAAAKPQAEESPYRSLRQLLAQDLSVRLNLPVESIQMTFRPQDERVLNLCEPHFKFQIDPVRARNLGPVSWNVIVFADNSQQRAQISATARAWQTQLVVAKPMAYKQPIREQDVIERRALIDRLLDDTVLTKPQAIGQQAARDLKPGVVLTAKLVDPIQLVRTGQFVTVIYRQGAVELKTVARALEPGSLGQTIRVKNEATKDVFEVVLTGPQTASMTSAAQPPGSTASAQE